jgi:hypothetical protein
MEVVAVIRRVFLHLAKMNDPFLEKRMNIKFDVKLEKNASDSSAMLSEAYGEEAIKNMVFVSGTNGSKRARACRNHE